MDSIKDTLSSVTSRVTAATASIVGTADTSTPASPVAAQTSDPLNPSEQPPDGSMDRQAVDQQSVPGPGLADRAAQGWASVKDSVGSMIGGAGGAGGAGGDGRAKDAVEQGMSWQLIACPWLGWLCLFFSIGRFVFFDVVVQCLGLAVAFLSCATVLLCMSLLTLRASAKLHIYSSTRSPGRHRGQGRVHETSP